MYLELSRSRPLEVCVKDIGERFRQMVEPRWCGEVIFDKLVSQGPRIRSLIIHKKWLPLHSRRRCIKGCLPGLETLSIVSETGWERGVIPPPTRLTALFKDGLPRLRRLFIPEHTPWPHNDFKNLTCICLYNQSDLEEELPELLRMLRGSPNLEELYIRRPEYSSDWNRDPPSDLGPAFQAYSLRKFHLHSFSNDAIVSILSTMRLQPNGVAVNLSDMAIFSDTLDTILSLFPPESGLGSAERLAVYHDSADLSNGPVEIIFCSPGGSLKIGGDLAEEDMTETAISLFGYIYRECAQTLKELWIYNFSDQGEKVIFANFSCFNLEKLVLWGCGEDGEAINRLCATLDPGTPGVQDLPAPLLRSLTIHVVYQQPQLERVVALCEGRSRTDHPLQEVSLVYGMGDIPEWVPRLCDSTPTPIRFSTPYDWLEEQMELPTVCTDEDSWWPAWE